MRVTGEVLALLGALLALSAAVGVIRLPTPLSRMHALTKASTVGVVLLALGAAFALPTLNDATSALLAGGLQLLTLPVAANLLARSSHRAEQRQDAERAESDQAAAEQAAAGRADAERANADPHGRDRP